MNEEHAISFESLFLLAASPRPQGNCDLAARLYARAVTAAGCAAAVTFLRDYEVKPCIACGACAKAAAKGMPLERPGPGSSKVCFGCPLTLHDSSAMLLHRILRARHLCIISPVYFYHLPAALKALLDRTQPFWELRAHKDKRITALPERVCQVILIAGRPQGEKLFEGSLLSLKYSLKNCNIRLAEPLLLPGLDQPGDLAAHMQMQKRITEYGQEAAGFLSSPAFHLSGADLEK